MSIIGHRTEKVSLHYQHRDRQQQLEKSAAALRQIGYTNGTALGQTIPSRSFSHENKVPPARFELTTFGLGNRRSILLSYEGLMLCRFDAKLFVALLRG